MPQTVALDFDGVMNNYEGHFNPANLGEPRNGLQPFIHFLKQCGYSVVVYSARDADSIREWLKQYSIFGIDAVYESKPVAEIYIDDRAIQFKGSFEMAKHDVKNFKTHWRK